MRPPADELADLFTSLSPDSGNDSSTAALGGLGATGSGIGSGIGSGTTAAQPQQQPVWSLQPQAQPAGQQQPGAVMLPAGGLANGGGAGHGHARKSSGIGHARTNSGSGAFEDLDIEFRKQRPMGMLPVYTTVS